MDREVHAIVYQGCADELYRAGRTLRSLAAAKIHGSFIGEVSPRTLRKVFGSARPVLFVRAGTWLADAANYSTPLRSASGKGLCALGAIRPHGWPEPAVAGRLTLWRDLLAKTGGDFARLPDSHPALREVLENPSALFLDEVAVAFLAQAGVSSFQEAAQIACNRFRLVHYPALDVYDGSAIRVLQVITSLHRGGAERVTLDLLDELARQGIIVQLATLGRAVREAFPTPPGTIQLANAPRRRTPPLSVLDPLAIAFGADVIHGHLISRAEARHLSAAGFPVVLTLHNTREGWPPGMSELASRDAALLVGCAGAVENEIRTAQLPVPARTVRNGIDVNGFRPKPQDNAARRNWRCRWGFGENDLVLISIANPRPQKRLHLLPPILAALRQLLGSNREARLVFCGEAVSQKPETQECIRRTQLEVRRLGLERHVDWVGSSSEVGEVLAASDVLVSTSAHEGLSLSQLEALAMGCAVVGTDVGGAREIAWKNPHVHLVPANASAEAYARILANLDAIGHFERASAFAWDRWSSRTMAAQYRRLYPRAIVRTGGSNSRDGLWLITNNFSVGGAQSSARRLLVGLSHLGEKVRAAVVEESPGDPTPGRKGLVKAGIQVRAVAPTSSTDRALDELLTALDQDPPEAIVFWNLRPDLKVLLAETLLDVPVFDVSPGEMYFASLARYFESCAPERPVRSVAEYGSRLAGVIVKYEGEAARARETLNTAVAVVPNGVPMPKTAGRRRHHDGFVVFGTAARIHPQKRLEDLLSAFRLVHNERPASALVVAGGVERGCESYAAELASLARDLPVTWSGDISEIEMFHECLDIFVMISEPAGCPNASLEAMASGLPVITTKVGGASEQVLDQVTGRLVPPRDAVALAAAMLDIARHPEKWPLLGRAAQDRIASRFGLPRMISDYRRIFLGRP